MNPRQYQTELYKAALERNVIIKLDTGSGKTYIALMVIKDFLKKPKKKKIFFLVKNASLGSQHEKYLKRHLFLDKEVGLYHGQMENTNVDMWSKETWRQYLSKHRIIVMTAKVFLDIINHKKFELSEICLLIFDEVHHLSKKDDYAQISESILGENHIRILGLSACIVKNPKNFCEIQLSLDEIESKLNCKIITTTNDISNEYSKKLIQESVVFDLYNDASISNVLENGAITFSNTSVLQEIQTDRDTEAYKMSKILRSFIRLNEQYGSRILNMILQLYLNQIDQIISNKCDPVDKKSLMDFKKFLELFKGNISSKLDISDKILKLLKLLKKIENEFKDKSCSTIIFVQEKIQALALDILLKHLVEGGIFSSFFKSSFITGHSKVIYPKELLMTTKRQTEILSNFRSNKFNLLIATNVIEEGLDVPTCNIVIKFDAIHEFRSYMQSKGRARATDAYFYIFSSTNDREKIEIKLKNFKIFNEVINDILIKKAIDYDDEEDDREPSKKMHKFDYMPYGIDGPKITLSTAASVLDRYIGRLRCNSIVEIKRMYDFCIEGMRKRAILQLPMPSPCTESIEGPWATNKKTAKEAVNLLACKILHEKYKELKDEDLLPREKYKEIINQMETQTFNNEQNRHFRPIAKCLSKEYQNDEEFNNYFYAYSIQFSKSIFENIGFQDHHVIPNKLELVILTKEPLLKQFMKMKFLLNPIGGPVETEIKFRGTACPWEIGSIDLLYKAHQRLFDLYMSKMKKFESRLYFDPSNSPIQMIVTIWNNHFNNIDVDFLNNFVKTPLVNKSLSNAISNPNDWIGAIIRPIYNQKDTGAHIVTKVKNNVKPTNIFENNQTHEEYILNKYNNNGLKELSERDRQLPLIEVKRLTTILSILNKEQRYMEDSRKLQSRDKSINFIPGFCETFPVSSDIWIHLCLFPSIQYRLNQLLVFSELSNKAHFKEFTSWSSIHEEEDKEAANTLELKLSKSIDMKCLIENTEYEVHPTKFIDNISAAFISQSCHEKVNLESLEIFGDSFLKFATSKILFHKYPLENEGSLTYKRCQLINNKRLYEVAMEIQLDESFFNSQFDPKSNYLFPLYSPNEDDDNLLKCKYKNKALSDCFEAVLGAIVIYYGENRGYEFLDNVKLDKNDELEFSNFITIDNNLLANNNQLIEQLSETNDFDWINELEDIIGYKFQNKSLLVQAITHPTSIRYRPFGCYQRLEFLGDALLDYIITIHIMHKLKILNPGEVSSLRSALVNNTIFAFVSVKYQLHKFIDYVDHSMNNIMPDVVDKLKEHDLYNSTEYLTEMDGYKVAIKNLGDIFESIIGAIFVDCNYRQNLVRDIILKMMEIPIKKFAVKIPKMKVVEFHKMYPNFKSSFEIEEFTNLVIMTASLGIENNNDEYIIKERNKNLCKMKLIEQLKL